jgi:hypothetical protein
MNKKLVMTVLVMFTLAFVQGTSALPPPVNQFLGIYDTNINNFNESLCRNCHTSSGTVSDSSGYTNNSIGGVPTRHHNLLSEKKINPTNGQLFGCQDCHPVQNNGQGVLIDRNCIDCHNGTAFYGNPTVINVMKPHHINTSYDDANIGQPAQARQCNMCHGSFVANYNDSHYIPSYATSFMITPLASAKAQNATTGELWGGCEACHRANFAASPPIFPNDNLHHGEVAFQTPGATCSWCHVTTSPSSPFFFGFLLIGSGNFVQGIDVRNSTFEQSDIANGFIEPGTTNVTFNGTACEKCHSVQSIHNIQYNYSATFGLKGFGHIGSNWDCNGCHASWVAGSPLMFGAIIPTLITISPEILTAGSASTVAIAGDNFVNDNYSSVVSVDGTEYIPSSITNSQIVVNIPALSIGVHAVQLVKNDVKSKLSTLIVVPAVTMSSATLNGGTLTIKGVGLGKQPITNAQQYVTFSHAGIISYSARISSWNDKQIVAILSGPVAAGDTIEVMTANGGQAMATIVTPAVLKSITISPSSATVNIRGIQTFTATAKDQNGNPMQGVSISWSSRNTNIGNVNPSRGTTDSNGQATTKFTAKKKGTAIVNINSGSVSGSATVTVQ